MCKCVHFFIEWSVLLLLEILFCQIFSWLLRKPVIQKSWFSVRVGNPKYLQVVQLINIESIMKFLEISLLRLTT